ncbi:hypothetical protein SAMN05216186_101336 [Pseudomonas indica]|uniref:Uncharacterized protein n=1 Tax=Pseudomonas indica TaxID=137658 RepID=A0A1G8TD27_9PSED|nr:hypothetical protein SAMN05216186_101336 [Pseudomonas indica]
MCPIQPIRMGMRPRTLRVRLQRAGAERPGMGFPRGSVGTIRNSLPTESFASRAGSYPCVQSTRTDRSHAPRGNAASDAPRPLAASGRGAPWQRVPTRERGNHQKFAPHRKLRQQSWLLPMCSIHPYRSFPRSAWECSLGRSASACSERDAERPDRGSHAERGNHRLYLPWECLAPTRPSPPSGRRSRRRR